MSASVRYGTASLVVLALVTLALWPFLDSAGRSGVLAAALVAFPVQVAAFAMLVRQKGRTTGFMAAWAGGMALRAVALLLVTVLVVRSGTQSAIPMLLSLAGFFFALLLLEGFFFKEAPASVLDEKAA
jgi:hypothetical protein